MGWKVGGGRLKVGGLQAAGKLGCSELSEWLCSVLYIFSLHAMINTLPMQGSGDICGKKPPMLDNLPTR